MKNIILIFKNINFLGIQWFCNKTFAPEGSGANKIKVPHKKVYKNPELKTTTKNNNNDFSTRLVIIRIIGIL